MMIPMNVATFMVVPVSSSAPRAPIRDRGNDSMMVRGCMKLSNWAASIR